MEQPVRFTPGHLTFRMPPTVDKPEATMSTQSTLATATASTPRTRAILEQKSLDIVSFLGSLFDFCKGKPEEQSKKSVVFLREEGLMASSEDIDHIGI